MDSVASNTIVQYLYSEEDTNEPSVPVLVSVHTLVSGTGRNFHQDFIDFHNKAPLPGRDKSVEVFSTAVGHQYISAFYLMCPKIVGTFVSGGIDCVVDDQELFRTIV